MEPRSPPKSSHAKNLPAKRKTVVKVEPTERDPSRGEEDESCETAMDMDLGKHGKIVVNRWSQKMCDI